MIQTRRIYYWILLSIIALTIEGCTSKRNTNSDGSNTNWLSYCEENADCAPDGACICGLCTITCDRDPQCDKGDRSASCVDPKPASSRDGCAALVKEASVRICLPDCEDDTDCGAHSVCIQNACWPQPNGIDDNRLDSSVLDNLDVDARNQNLQDGEVQDPIGADAQDLRNAEPQDERNLADRDASVNGLSSVNNLIENSLDHLDASMDFSEPIYLPDPEILISNVSSVSSIIGVWEEEHPNHVHVNGPLRLTIRPASNGTGYIGTMTLTCDSSTIDEFCSEQPSFDPTDLGSFADPRYHECEILSSSKELCSRLPLPIATDPDSEYPPSSYLTFLYQGQPLEIFEPQETLMPDIDYRIFDASVEGNRLSFWTTINELWRDWCAIQTSYPVVNEDRQEYYCLPDPEPSPYLRPKFGVEMPPKNSKEILCALDNSVCGCNREGCKINYRQSVRAFEFLIEGEVMRGTSNIPDSSMYGNPARMESISPDSIREITLYRREGEPL